MIEKERMQAAIEAAEKHWKYLHTIPEMAFDEQKTTAYIKNVCAEYPVKFIDIGMETGLVCYLDAGAGTTVALRADIDAVPTEEGCAHFCGHDAHTASLLGAMHFLCGDISALKHNVLFVFQPAEEGTRGARALLDHGLLDKVPQRPSAIFGIHNRPEEQVGDIVVHKGPLMSEKSVFRIALTGKPGHGSMPHKCIDPITAASAIIMGVRTIVSLNTDPFKPCICTVSSVHGGTTESSAPETARLTGYIRSFDSYTHAHMEERLECLARRTAEAYECGCDIEIERVVPAVDNRADMYEIALKAAEKALEMSESAFGKKGNIVDSDPCLASEDFAVYSAEIPSFLYWVGSGTPGKENAMWHDPAFRVDPHYTETAVPVLAACALI